MRYLFLCLCTLIVAGCANQHAQNLAHTSETVESAPQATATSAKADASRPVLIGGWAPVFFTKLDTQELDSIAEGMNNGRIKRAVISYPTRMQNLANQIANYLQKQTQQSLAMQAIELKDTNQVKYNLTQVVVTLYFN